MQLTGFHHLTAVTADAARNHAFYTQTLGLRLVKKTVNQDDVSAYHLFYADGLASPGTDITFFDWPVGRERRGTNSTVRTGLRVDSAESLKWWQARFESLGVLHGTIVERDGRATLDFEDFEGQRLSLVVDATAGELHPWEKSPVPAEHQIRGLGPITISVPELRATDVVLTQVMNLRRVREYPFATDGIAGAQRDVQVYQMGADGAQVACTTWLFARRTSRNTMPGSSGSRNWACARVGRSTGSISGACIFGSRTESCSRSRLTARASARTSRWRRWASASRCRPSSNRAARRLSGD
jgi:glyoxalase family protein